MLFASGMVSTSIRLSDRSLPTPIEIPPYSQSADLLLLIEIEDSSWDCDRQIKLSLYAETDISPV